MARPDGKLFQLMADEVCHDILRRLLASVAPLTQKALTAASPYDSSTISRRMGDLEDLGLVQRPSAHAPYHLQFREQTRALRAQARSSLGSPTPRRQRTWRRT